MTIGILVRPRDAGLRLLDEYVVSLKATDCKMGCSSNGFEADGSPFAPGLRGLLVGSLVSSIPSSL